MLIINILFLLKKHENYNDLTIANDIAILVLSEFVELTNSIQISCLPDSASSSYPGGNLSSIAVGWGKTSTNGESPSLLKNAAIQIYNGTNDCKVYGSSFNAKSNICAGKINIFIKNVWVMHMFIYSSFALKSAGRNF